MTAFAAFLSDKVERYIELRRSLGYAFNKQAGTLRAFVRYVERSQLGAPATRTMALDFVLSFGGAAEAARSVTACCADSTSTWSSTTPRPRSWSAKLSRGPGRFRRRAS